MKSFIFDKDFISGARDNYELVPERRLSDLKDYFFDKEVVERMLSNNENPVIYRAYMAPRLTDPLIFERCKPSETSSSEPQFTFGVNIVQPGRIGREYYHTRGHFHALDPVEIYFGKGNGIFLIQTKDGEVAHLPVRSDRWVALRYDSKKWAHQCINTGAQEMINIFLMVSLPCDKECYLINEYEWIEKHGWKKLVVEENGRPTIIDNPDFRP